MGNDAKDGWDRVQGAVMWGSGTIIPSCLGDMMDGSVARSNNTRWWDSSPDLKPTACCLPVGVLVA